MGALVMGLWNRLTRHQDRSAPFRLTRIQIEATRGQLVSLASMRRQELDGFVEGLFGPEKSIDLPERAHRALDILGEMRAGFAAVFVLASDQAKGANIKDVERTLRNSREMTKIAEREMHAVVLSCTRARRELMAMLPTGILRPVRLDAERDVDRLVAHQAFVPDFDPQRIEEDKRIARLQRTVLPFADRLRTASVTVESRSGETSSP
jgi:hypothetical protein